MSFYRFCKVVAYRNRPRFQFPIRGFASRRGQSRSLVSRLLIYGAVGTTVTGGGIIAYANYDPDFKQTVDTYIPGFASFSDLDAILWNQGLELAKQGWNTIKAVILPDKGNTGIQIPKYEEQSKNESAVTIADNSSNEQLVIEQERVENVTEKVKEEVEEMVDKTEKEAVKLTDQAVETGDQAGEAVSPDQMEKPLSEELLNKVEGSVETEDKQPQSPEQLQAPSEVGPGTHTEVQSEKVVKEQEVEQEFITDTTALEPVSVPDPTVEAKNVSVENELRSSYQDYIMQSDKVITALQSLVQAMEIHQTKIQQSVTATPLENETDIETIAESIGSSQKEVAEALGRVKECKAAQGAVSKKLSSAVSEAMTRGICTELSEQICEKVLEYEKSFEAAEEDVKQMETRHRSWQEQYKEKLKEEKDSTPQLPLADLDTQQEALLIMLRKKIENMEEKERKKIEETLGKQQEEFQKQLETALQDQRAGFDEQLKKKEDELHDFYEDKLKVKLYQQSNVYSSHLEERLKAQAEELSAQIGEDHSRKLAEKDAMYHQQLAAAMAQLRGIQSMISTVSEAGKSTRRQQTVRNASDSLTGAIINANTDLNPYSKHSISREVSTLREAATSDEFIQSVLLAIPKEAIEEGITSESALVRRFRRVRKICRRVALVGEEGGGLGMYLLSFIQSLLTFDMIYDKMVTEQDTKAMNTFKLLSCANMYLDKGDLETAVRLVNQLSGEPRRVAQDWVKDACLYLETKQAVLVVSEYLAASCFTTVQ